LMSTAILIKKDNLFPQGTTYFRIRRKRTT
jgi:hypothetical protein